MADHECNQIAQIARIESQIEELTKNMSSLADMVIKYQEWQVHHERHAAERFEKIIKYGMSAIGTLAVAMIGIIAPVLSHTIDYIGDNDKRLEDLDRRMTEHISRAFAHIPDKTHPGLYDNK
jgi:hypothetical protein